MTTSPAPTDPTAIEALVRAARDASRWMLARTTTILPYIESPAFFGALQLHGAALNDALAAYAQRQEIGRRPKILAKVEAELCRASSCSKCHDTGAVEAECSMPGNTRKCDQCDPYALWREIKYLRARVKLLGDALDEDCQRATVAAFAEHAYAQRPPASEPAPAATDIESRESLARSVDYLEKKLSSIEYALGDALKGHHGRADGNIVSNALRQARREGREEALRELEVWIAETFVFDPQTPLWKVVTRMRDMLARSQGGQ
jgi:hypothetical protein